MSERTRGSDDEREEVGRGEWRGWWSYGFGGWSEEEERRKRGGGDGQTGQKKRTDPTRKRASVSEPVASSQLAAAAGHKLSLVVTIFIAGLIKPLRE